jgi:O-antigen/teichoic acid export membrane protein
LAGWNLISNLAIMGFIQGTNIILNFFFGPLLNAAYSVASQAYSGIRQFTSSFQLASNPQIVKLYSQNDLNDMHKLVINVCKYSFYLIFVLSFPFILNAEVILSIWLKETPAHSVMFFILLLLFAYVDVMAYPLDVAAQATGQLKKYSIVVSVCVISSLPISFVFFKLGAVPETILYVAIVVAFIGIFLRLLLLNKLIQLPIRQFVLGAVYKPVLLLIIATLVLVPIKIWINLDGIILSIIFFIFSFMIVCILCYKLGLVKNERMMIKEYALKFINKITKS